MVTSPSLPRLIAWYATCTGAVAIAPWLGVLLTDRGWTESEATLWLAVVPAGRLVAIPLWAAAADRFGAGPVLRGSLALATAGALAMAAPDPWLAAIAILGWAWGRAPAFPIVDAATVALVGRGYGRIRAVGSLAYLALALANGALRDVWRPAPIALSAVLALCTLAITFALGPIGAAPRAPSRSEWLALWRHPVLAPLVAVSVLHGAALSVYDNLLAVHIEHLGLGAWVTGAAIAAGVAVEVGVLLAGRPLLDRIGPRTLLVLAVASGIPRFAVIGLAHDPLSIVAVQLLHGLGFGCYWLAGTALSAEHAPDGLRNSAQALLPTAMFGAGPLVGLGAASLMLRVAPTPILFGATAGISAVAVLVLIGLARVSAAEDGA